MKRNVEKGFTLIEMMVVLGIVSVLMALATVGLSQFERKSALASVVNSMIADIKQQQIKAMAGDGEGSGATSDFGVHIAPTGYTLFRNSYSAGASNNLVISMPDNLTLSTTFSGSEMLFTKGSGEVSAAHTITITDTTTGQLRVISVNKMGVITGIN